MSQAEMMSGRHCLSLLTLITCLGLVLSWAGVGAGQEEGETTIAYKLRYVSPENVEKIFQPLIAAAPGVKLEVDPARSRLRVTGPAWAHELMEQVIDRLDHPPTVPQSTTGTTAQTPSQPSSQGTTSLSPPGAPAEPAAAQLLEPQARENTAPPSIRRHLVPLAKGTAGAIRRDLLRLFAARFQVPADPSLPWVLPTSMGPLHVEVNIGRDDVLLDGPAPVVEQFARLLAAITDRYQRPAAGKSKAVDRKVVLLNRSVHTDLLQMMRSSSVASQDPRNRELGNQDPGNNVKMRLAAAQPPVPQPASPPPASDPTAEEAEQGPPLPQLEGVEMEMLPDLDAIILKGREQDLQQLAEIIRELEQLSRETQPALEIIHLRYTSSLKMAELIEETAEDFIGTRQGRAQVIPLGKPNSLLLIGWGEAVTALKEFVEKLDRPVDPESQFRVFPLKYAAATALQTTLNGFFANRDGGLGTTIESTVDTRTNSLIVHAAPRDMNEVAQIIERLDTPSGQSIQRTRVFVIQNSLAADIAETLQDAIQATPANQRSAAIELVLDDEDQQQVVRSGNLADVQITVDARKNTLIISALPENFDVIEALIAKLDTPGTIAKIKIFPVRNSDAASLIETLRSLIPSQAGTTSAVTPQLSSAPGESSLLPLRFTVDVRSNSIIAIGSEGDLKIVDALITRLDETDSTQRKNLVYQLKNSPAVDVALAINEFLRNTRQVESATPGTLNPYEQLEKEVVVVPEPVSNKLIVSATDRYFSEIQQMIERLDAQPPQVMIQALIAEIALDDSDEFGIELGIQDSVLFDRSLLGDIVTVTSTSQTSTADGILTETTENIVGASNVPGFDFNSTLPLGNSGSSKSLSGAGNVGGQGISNFAVGRGNAELGFGGLVLSASSQNISFLLRALEESRRLEVLSRPQVLTLDNQPAFIQVGQRVPRITGSSINQVGQQNTVELENVGLILGVTPRISPEGNVTMEIDAEKSSIGPENEGIPVSVSTDGTVIRSPRVDVTSAQATVSAADGETIILGGLITKSRREVHRKVPYLGDIPILKTFFRFDSVSDRRTELLIILTPHIVRSPDDMERLKEIEMSRMSWCAADVFEIHGEVFTGPESSLLFHDESEVDVVYPHVDPRGARLQNQVEGAEILPVPEQSSPAPVLQPNMQLAPQIQPPLPARENLLPSPPNRFSPNAPVPF